MLALVSSKVCVQVDGHAESENAWSIEGGSLPRTADVTTTLRDADASGPRRVCINGYADGRAHASRTSHVLRLLYHWPSFLAFSDHSETTIERVQGWRGIVIRLRGYA
jgi:hypothetical protein